MTIATSALPPNANSKSPLSERVPLDVPVRILIAHFPKLALYEFRLENAQFPEFLKVLEKVARTGF
jgi:hypothetical protein